MSDVYELLGDALRAKKTPIKVVKDDKEYDIVKSVVHNPDGTIDLYYESFKEDGSFSMASTEKLYIYVGFLKNWSKNIKYITEYNIETSYEKYCWDHEWVDYGFNHSRFVCRKCDKEKPEYKERD